MSGTAGLEMSGGPRDSNHYSVQAHPARTWEQGAGALPLWFFWVAMPAYLVWSLGPGARGRGAGLPAGDPSPMPHLRPLIAEAPSVTSSWSSGPKSSCSHSDNGPFEEGHMASRDQPSPREILVQHRLVGTARWPMSDDFVIDTLSMARGNITA